MDLEHFKVLGGLVFLFTLHRDAFDRASCLATLGPLFAQVAWLRGYDLRQSTRLKSIPSCLAGRVIGRGNSGLWAPYYFCPAIIGEKLEATDSRWLWMKYSISYSFCQLRLIHWRHCKHVHQSQSQNCAIFTSNI